MANTSYYYSMSEVLYGGVDHTIPGNGGPVCVMYLSLKQRVIETIVVTTLSLVLCCAVWKRVDVPNIDKGSHTPEPCGKRFLLVIICLTFGIEIGYKFATKQLIYLLNPCHIITMVQIYLLAAPPCQRVLIVFRLHMHTLHGPLLAIILPVVNTRLLPCEQELYWVQHILIYFIIPFYLISLGGAYTPEPVHNFYWPLMTTGCLYIYHFPVLQVLGLLAEVNLNSILCPAITDPFAGPYYRCFAIVHQTLLVLLHSKLYFFICRLVVHLPLEGAASGYINHSLYCKNGGTIKSD